MADPNQPGADTDPASAAGKTGLQGGYGGDTGFASDQAQKPSGQVQDSADGGDVIPDEDPPGDKGDPSAASGSDTRAGSDVGGSASGGEPKSNPDDALQTERHANVQQQKGAS